LKNLERGSREIERYIDINKNINEGKKRWIENI
jgi:hypothetical protein